MAKFKVGDIVISKVANASQPLIIVSKTYCLVGSGPLQDNYKLQWYLRMDDDTTHFWVFESSLNANYELHKHSINRTKLDMQIKELLDD